jgi:dTDP-glucose 4,6-dehydratase
MAQLLADQYPEAGIKVVFELSEDQKFGYNPTVKIELDTSKLYSLGWHAEVGLIEMFQRMIQSMKIRELQ